MCFIMFTTVIHFCIVQRRLATVNFDFDFFCFSSLLKYFFWLFGDTHRYRTLGMMMSVDFHCVATRRMTS